MGRTNVPKAEGGHRTRGFPRLPVLAGIGTFPSVQPPKAKEGPPENDLGGILSDFSRSVPAQQSLEGSVTLAVNSASGDESKLEVFSMAASSLPAGLGWRLPHAKPLIAMDAGRCSCHGRHIAANGTNSQYKDFHWSPYAHMGGLCSLRC